MEVKINREIREYSENMFFGLTMRQFFFSVLGIIVACVIYFAGRNTLGLEITTWLSVLGVVPFALIGFVKYNGMPAEKIAWAWIKCRVIYPRRYTVKPVSIYYQILEQNIRARESGKKQKDRIKKNKQKRSTK